MSSWVEHYKMAEEHLVAFYDTTDETHIAVALVHATLANVKTSPTDERISKSDDVP